MKVAIFGAGLIGLERVTALEKIRQEREGFLSEVFLYDPDSERLESLRKKFSITVVPSLDRLLGNNPDWIFICTPHDVAKDIAIQALQTSSNILIEKPLGRSLKECDDILDKLPRGKSLFVGFNYRFYRGIADAILDAVNGKFGGLISVNMVLGHGNSPGMEKSWKLNPVRCGGGCLIDPGVHLLDLALLLAKGRVSVEKVKTWAGFWKTGIEEEAHILISDEDGTIFNIQTSLNRWRSTFRLEINGTEGYGIVEGRGRSYGPIAYRTGIRWGWRSGISQVESEVQRVVSDPGDDSFFKETLAVLSGHSSRQLTPSGSLWPCNFLEGRKVMELLEKCR